MHRCLQILEIQSIVFDYLDVEFYPADDDPQGRAELASSRKTLAALASSCHTFSELALKKLWEYQVTLGPLIKVMPSDLWTLTCFPAFESGSKKKQLVVTFVRPLKESDWERFDRYARKIDSIGPAREPWEAEAGSPHFDSDVDIHQDVLQAFTSYRPPRTFLPNLKRFSLRIDSPLSHLCLPYYSCLLHKEIVDIDLCFHSAGDIAACSLLSSIPRLCPEIQELVVLSEPHPVDSVFSSALSEMLCKLPCIKSLGVTAALSKSAFLYLGAVPSLDDIQLGVVDVTRGTDAPHPLVSMENGRFSALTGLSFEARSWVDVCLIVDAMPRPFLTLGMQVEEITTLPSDEELFSLSRVINTLSRHVCCSTLTDLHMYGPDKDDRHTTIDLQGLFQLTSLEALRLFIPPTCTIDDAWLSQAAMTWPALRILSILSRSQTTLLGLTPLIRHCPNLSELGISSRWAPFDTQLLGDVPPTNTAIKYLTCWDYTIDNNVLAIFRCLVIMFPRLRELRDGPALDQERRANFQKLQSYIIVSVVNS
ncbi:hypothetical protein DXG01_004439 [Tephrocybe rancida]|nr:hypothetical protein DXG01_004439 [Tephrocybe rancida]